MLAFRGRTQLFPGDPHLPTAQFVRCADRIDSFKLQNPAITLSPNLFHVASRCSPCKLSKNNRLFGEKRPSRSVRSVAKYLAPVAPTAHDASQRDELLVHATPLAYSRISSVYRFLTFMPAAPSNARIDFAVRPFFPITFPKSDGVHLQLKHANLIPRHRSYGDLLRLVDQSLGDQFHQLDNRISVCCQSRSPPSNI